MKLICAWCQQEGVPAFLCEVEPLNDPTETHGICARHRFEVLQELDNSQIAHAAVVQEAAAAEADDQALLGRWIAGSREMLEGLLPGLIAEVPIVARRAEATERAIRVPPERRDRRSRERVRGSTRAGRDPASLRLNGEAQPNFCMSCTSCPAGWAESRP
jgi:hypothetical protein